MTKREKQRLVRAFEVAYELAYRRGYQHGFVARDQPSHGSEGRVATWRFGQVKRTETRPPGSVGRPCRIIERMTFESRDQGEVIEAFLRAEPRIETHNP